MHIVIAVSLGTILTMVIIVWVIIGSWQAESARKRLQKLRARQKIARMKALEKALKPPIWRRIWPRRGR